jgi:hypothetical protein
MSDQVIFTKEEVEKIKRALSNTRPYLPIDVGTNEVVSNALALLDSSRPRPKIDKMLLAEIGLKAIGAEWYEWENGHASAEIIKLVESRGFDVED